MQSNSTVYPKEIIDKFLERITGKAAYLCLFLKRTFLPLPFLLNLQKDHFVKNTDGDYDIIYRDKFYSTLSKEDYISLVRYFLNNGDDSKLPFYFFFFGTKKGKKSNKQALYVCLKLEFLKTLKLYFRENEFDFSIDKLIMSFVFYSEKPKSERLIQLIKIHNFIGASKKNKKYELGLLEK